MAAKPPSSKKRKLDELNRDIDSFGTYWKSRIDSAIPPLPIKVDDNRQQSRNGHSYGEPSECAQCNEKHKKIIRLEHKYENLMHKHDQLEVERDKLRICVRGLAQLLKEGRKPDKNLVKMVKNPICARSKSVEDIKQKIQKTMSKIHPSKEALIELQPLPEEIRDKDDGWITDEALRNRIAHYIQLNALNSSQTKENPKIVLQINDESNSPRRRSSRKRNRNKNQSSQSDGLIRDTFDLSSRTVQQIRRRDLMERHKLPTGYRVEKLVGEFGVRAKHKIPRGTVIGQYTGTEYLEDEYDKLFSGTTEKIIRDIYAFETALYEPRDDIKDNHDEEEDEDMHDGSKYNDYYTKMCAKHTLILDGYDDIEENVMTYINDCRMNLTTDTQPTEEDEKHWNCSYRTVMVNGEPAVFIIARKNINVGDDLNVYYGKGYGRQLKDLDNHERMMARMQGLVNNTVLKIVGWNDGIPEVYTLEH